MFFLSQANRTIQLTHSSINIGPIDINLSTRTR
jgi:hypothetical protein